MRGQRTPRALATKRAGYCPGKGEAFYRKAAEEIKAARAEGWSWPKIGEALDLHPRSAEKLVAWATDSGGADAFPYAEPGRASTDVRGTRRVLGTGSPEQIKQALAELPAGRIEVIQTVAQDVAWEKSDALLG